MVNQIIYLRAWSILEEYPEIWEEVKKMQDKVHELRKHIDAVIEESQALQEELGRNAGGREVALVVTKLQEGKMWAGKILEALGSPFPPELADKAE